MKTASYQHLKDKYGLDDQEASIVEWQFHYTGGFTTNLWQTIISADDDNLVRIGRGFPVHVSAYIKFRGTPGWWERVEKIVEDYHANESTF